MGHSATKLALALLAAAALALSSCGSGAGHQTGDGGQDDGRLGGDDAMGGGDAPAGDGAPASDGGQADGPTGVPPGNPVIFYSDLASAPAGAWVTVWGRGFGSDRGTSRVTVGAADAAGYVTWSDRMIELQVPSGAAAGAAALTVRTSGGDSPALPFAVHQGRRFFVATDGNDSWSGTLPAPSGGDGPFRTLGAGRDALAAGDVLYLRTATYTSVDNYNAILSLRDVPTGTASQPVAVVAYPGETVTLGDNTVQRTLSVYRGDNGPALDYLTIAKLRMRPSCDALAIQNGAHGRFVGNEISGATDACMSGTIEFLDWGNGVDGWKLLGNYIHDNGNTKLEHGIYLGGYGHNRDIEIAWNVITRQAGGRGIQLFGHEASDYIERVSIHDNEISEIDRDGIVLGNTDADVLHLTDIGIYNNLFYRTGRCTGWGVRVGNATATGVAILNNTFYDNGAGTASCDQSGGSVEAQVLVEDAAPAGVTITNNVLAAQGSEEGVAVTVSGNVISGSHNLWTGTAGAWDQAPRTGPPTFVNAAGADVHLQAGSPGVDQGTATSVTVDHDGVARPQGGGVDIGAYER
jgi:hypothetical protein